MPERSVSAITLRVEGMTCDLCAQRIRESLRKEEGVLDVEVSLSGGVARVLYDANMTVPGKILRSRIFTQAFQIESSDGEAKSHRYRAELSRPRTRRDGLANKDTELVGGVSSSRERVESSAIKEAGSQVPSGSSSMRSMLMLALGLAACCVLPLVLLLGGGLAFYSYLEGNYFILSVALLVILVLFVLAVIGARKRRKSVSCG